MRHSIERADNKLASDVVAMQARTAEARFLFNAAKQNPVNMAKKFFVASTKNDGPPITGMQVLRLPGQRRTLSKVSENSMPRFIQALCILFVFSFGAQAQVVPFPADFSVHEIETNGATLNVRVGGKGPAVVLLHGYGETGDMWGALAVVLMRDHTVIVPDLRGMGMSSHVENGFDKKNQARDVAGILKTLDVGDVDVVAHDIGNMVAFAFAAENRDRVKHLVLIDAPVPGIGPWEEILKNPLLWHFRFGGPDMERLVAGRERIYLDRFWNEFSATPAKFTEESRAHYAALYARSGNMRAGFAQFAAFDQDAIDNKAFLTEGGKLKMPVLALGGEKSFGLTMAVVMRAGADNVAEGIVPGSGHWIMEENPDATIKLVTEFLNQK